MRDRAREREGFDEFWERSIDSSFLAGTFGEKNGSYANGMHSTEEKFPTSAM